MADPANDDARARLLASLRGVGDRLGGGARRLAAMAARQVERRAAGSGMWERELMRVRHHIGDLPSGPERAAMLDVYGEMVARAPQIAQANASVGDRARIRAALENEGRAVMHDPLGPAEREQMVQWLREARRAVGHA